MINKNKGVGEVAEKSSAMLPDALSIFKDNEILIKKPEVLAPAGGPDSLEAAVRAGADAVYFGAGSFNARRNAKNFSQEDIAAATEFCRIRGVKTYLTLNTLVGDNERGLALESAYSAASLGVDAFIVQDIGLASLLKQYLPQMPLHASTQMSVHSEDALETVAELGFCRVVPAREMDRTALDAFCKKAAKLGLEVETFIHGALCMCLSGQCYLSAMLGSRSGNRGLCAQPCRLPFAAAGGNAYDLSLKDMSLIDHVDELKKMGVASLKIEGRMKRPEYVAAATAVVRAAVDGVELPEDAKALLSGIFSRNGHTDGYFINNLGKAMFGTRTETDEKLSAALTNSAHELYRRERQAVPIKGEFLLKADEPATLMVTDNNGNSEKVCGEIPQAAKTVAVTAESVAEKLSKLGGTPYYFDKLKVDIDNGLFINSGALNALRREATERLTEIRAKKLNDIKEGQVTLAERRACRPAKSVLVAQFRSVAQIPENLSGVHAVILPAECDFSKLNLDPNINIIADIPRGVMHGGKRMVEYLKNAKANGAVAAVAGNLAGFEFAKEAGLPVLAGFGINIFNSDSVKTAEMLDAKAAVLSFELQLDDAVNLGGNIPRGVFVYGKLPLMCFRNCPLKNGDGCKTCSGGGVLTDRKGIEFSVMCRGEFSEMFNSVPLWMLDRPVNTDFKLLYFTDEPRDRCEEIIDAAIKGKEPDCDYTRGLYYRGVM